jgi:hypothetical protein
VSVVIVIIIDRLQKKPATVYYHQDFLLDAQRPQARLHKACMLSPMARDSLIPGPCLLMPQLCSIQQMPI